MVIELVGRIQLKLLEDKINDVIDYMLAWDGNTGKLPPIMRQIDLIGEMAAMKMKDSSDVLKNLKDAREMIELLFQDGYSDVVYTRAMYGFCKAERRIKEEFLMVRQ